LLPGDAAYATIPRMDRLCFRRAIVALLLAFVTPLALAKDTPFQVVSWPESGQPLLRFTFSKFKEIGGMGKERTYITDTAVQNLSDKTISNASFSLYVFDKDKARVGEGYMNLTNVAAGQTVKFQITLAASGTPASVTVSTSVFAPRTVQVTVNSVPQGATFKLDGKEMGTTPKIVDVGVGKHTLDFSKEGFNSGKFPLEITSRDASGGSVSYELGSAAHDTIELRDGSILAGDLVSINGMQVQVRIGGNSQTFDRNQVKRILLTERDPASN
jgi:PEGA domain